MAETSTSTRVNPLAPAPPPVCRVTIEPLSTFKPNAPRPPGKHKGRNPARRHVRPYTFSTYARLVASAFPRALQVRRHFRKENQPPHTQGFSNGIKLRGFEAVSCDDAPQLTGAQGSAKPDLRRIRIICRRVLGAYLNAIAGIQKNSLRGVAVITVSVIACSPASTSRICKVGSRRRHVTRHAHHDRPAASSGRAK